MRQTILLLLLLPSLIPLRAQTAPRQDYALFFACETYENSKSWKTLPGLIEECKAIRGDLVARYGFSADSKVVENPTLSQIYAELDRWRAKSYGPDDQLLVFFSGHGQFLDALQEGFFIPFDGRPSNSEPDARRWYSLLQLPRHINTLGCRHILLAIDACYSGTIDSRVALKDENEEWAEPKNDADKAFRRFVHDRLANKSRILMTSGGKTRTRHPSDFARWFRETLATLGGKDRMVMPAEIEDRWPPNTQERPLAGHFEGHEPGGTFLFVYQPENIPISTTAPDYDDDGTPDKDDKCPTLVGPTNTKGCPDGDSDGTADKFDQCPTVAGPADNNGCPQDIDADDDGTFDKDDLCPTVAGPTNTKGCPDGDSDGTADKFDQCPTVAGPTNTKGCPDGDRDGVADLLDHCDTQPGPASNNGCPLGFDATPILSPVAHRRKSGLTMIPVEGGTYQMGSPTSDPNHQKDECQHLATVKTFAIGQYELTQSDWREVMGSDPPNLKFKGCDECPVENVSWDDIQEFLKKANTKYGRLFRLPTEEEWEYAAIGGKKSKGYTYAGGNDLDKVGWYWENSGKQRLSGTWDYERMTKNDCKVHPVGQKTPNELGLYDMSGNVWEWCQNVWGPYSKCLEPKTWEKDCRVLRGGSWYNLDHNGRPALRLKGFSPNRSFNGGFRVAQD